MAGRAGRKSECFDYRAGPAAARRNIATEGYKEAGRKKEMMEAVREKLEGFFNENRQYFEGPRCLS